MRKLNRVLAAALAGAMVISMAACGDSKPAETTAAQGGSTETKAEETKAPAAEGEKIIKLGMTNAWATWNPYADSGNYTDLVSDQLFEKLWVSKEDGTVDPRLCESYEVAPDHTYLTLHLNKDAKWSDGQPVTADDVIYSYWLDTNPDFNSVKRDQCQYVKGTTPGGVQEADELGLVKIDDYTVQLNMKEAMNELPILTMFDRYFYIVPEHVLKDKSMDELNESDTWKNIGVYAGPWKYDTCVDGESIELVANDDYYLGRPDFDRLIIKVVAGANLLANLMTGDLDVIAGAGVAALPLADWSSAVALDYLECVSQPNYAYQTMIINTTSDKIPNAACRHAINTAINRQSIVDNLLLGEGTVIYAPYSNNHPYVTEADLTLPAYDPAAAKAELEANGFDFNQTLELIVPTGNEVRIQSTVLIQQDLAAIGVKVNITQYDFSTLMDMMRNGQYDLGMCGSAGSLEPTEASAWLNNGGTVNFPCIQDSTYIDWFNKNKGVLELEDQKAAYTELWQYLLDDSPIVYLYSANHLDAYNKTKLDNVDTSLFAQINWATWTWKYIGE